MAISKTRLKTLKRWANDNAEKEISTFYMESDNSGCSVHVKGDINFLLNGFVNAIADFALRCHISPEEITSKITGLIAEKKRKSDT